MRFEVLYRVSFHLMLFLATLALSVDNVRDIPLAPLYPLVVAVTAGVALMTVDRQPSRRLLNRGVANLLALGSFALSYTEYRHNPSLLVIALGHWLVYLQLIKMLLPKTIKDDWFLFLLALMQVVVGAFQPGDWIGAVLLAWGVVAVWTLGLFHLRREASRSTAKLGLASDYTGAPYPNLVDLPFIVLAARVALWTLVLGITMFLLLPRWSSSSGAWFQSPNMAAHLTGFSDSIQLGQMGEILENDTVVMTVELYDGKDRLVPPPPESYWRGVTLQRYENGRWYRAPVYRFELDEEVPRPPRIGHPNRQVYKLDRLDTDALFSLRPMFWAEGPDLMFNRFDGTLYRFDLRPDNSYSPRVNRHPGSYTYTVFGSFDPVLFQTYEFFPRPRAIQNELIEVPAGMRSRLQPLVKTILANVPADPIQRVAALEAYLRDNPSYRYSLEMRVRDPKLDPVEDFLFNHKVGHCEYFASALVLMLRAAGIPARMVNGFKGGDWNTLAKITYIRQKYAHSWVEALVGQDDANHPIWKTLDPSPVREREELVAQIGGLGTRFHILTDFLRYIWVFYIVGFDSFRQQRIIYGPIRSILTEAGRGFQLIWEQVLGLLHTLYGFAHVHSFFSVRGSLVTMLLLLGLAGAIWGLHWLARRMGRWWSRPGTTTDDITSGVATYRRLLRLLASLDLRRRPPETPREFGHRATGVLEARGVSLSGVPSHIIEAFYRDRFGHQPIPLEDIRALDEQLDALEAALGPS